MSTESIHLDPGTAIPGCSHSGPVTSQSGLLLVFPEEEDRLVLGGILADRNYSGQSAHSTREALDQVNHCRVSVILCERDPPDGTWRELWETVRMKSAPPLLIVVSRFADESLWAEVLNLGGYDVLLKPFEPPEVLRIVENACRTTSAGDGRKHGLHYC